MGENDNKNSTADLQKESKKYNCKRIISITWLLLIIENIFVPNHLPELVSVFCSLVVVEKITDVSIIGSIRKEFNNHPSRFLGLLFIITVIIAFEPLIDIIVTFGELLIDLFKQSVAKDFLISHYVSALKFISTLGIALVIDNHIGKSDNG